MTQRPAGPDEPLAAALLTGLLDPLLDARSRPSAEQFDALISAALAGRQISSELARELRFWQRASVHELADHVRTVVPAVLPVALAAVAAAAGAAADAATSAARTWDDARDTGEAAPVPTAGDDAVEQHLPDEPVAETSIEVDPTPDHPDDITEPAPEEALVSPAAPEDETAAATNPHLRRRLFVAGLTSTA